MAKDVANELTTDDQPQLRPISESVCDLALNPSQFDYLQAIRLIEAAYSSQPRLGKARRLSQEAVRLSQEPWLAFPASNVSYFDPAEEDQPAKLEARFLGLFGPQGPLPLHLTVLARERMVQERDPTFKHFCDIFHHRLMALFYRAWAESQPAVHADRPDGRLENRLGSLAGLGAAPLAGADSWRRRAELRHLAFFAKQQRSADGLAHLLAHLFGFCVKVHSFEGGWLKLPEGARFMLGSVGRLGVDAIIGSAVFERQHRFRIEIGPIDLVAFERLLPGGTSLARLRDMVRLAVGSSFEWDLQLVLAKEYVPQLALDGSGRLGLTTWLHQHSPTKHARDVHFEGSDYGPRPSGAVRSQQGEPPQ